MRRVFLLSIILFLNSIVISYSQIKNNESVISGIVINKEKQIALPYTNISVLHKPKGTVSNEKGHFSIDISDLDKIDTIRFQFIGYKTKDLTIEQLDSSSTVSLKEDIINLSEAIIFGNAPNPLSIVKNVIKNKDLNYSKTTCKKQTFIRQRGTEHFNKFKLKYKKSTIAELNKEAIDSVEKYIPKQTTSYTDFLGYIYMSENMDDSIIFKIDPIRTVSLKEKDIAELEQIESTMENLFKISDKRDYWKVKIGILGIKVDEGEDDEISKDTINKKSIESKDSPKDNERKLSYFNSSVLYKLYYCSFNNEKQWEFLYDFGKYKYTLAGGTSVNGEDVYIIDFEPDNNGKYIGRMYISIKTFALIRADYEYAPNKDGLDIKILGIGYAENQFNGSIYFEKNDDNYELKYFSIKEGTYLTIDRSFALIKKRKRAFLDKT